MNAWKYLVAASLALVAAAALDAAVARKIPPVTVVEGETLSFDSLRATSVRSSNPAVFGAALRDSGEAIVSGTRLGEAQFDYVDERGVFATRTVTVVPPYWELLNKMFADDPEITIGIVGDKIVVDGSTANVDTLKRAENVKGLDAARIVSQVTYSTAQIGVLVTDFLNRSGVTNVSVKVVGREVCLAGRLYDQQTIDRLRELVSNFLKDYPGIVVNADELRIFKQKIMISIEFLSYNDSIARNLGFSGPEAITAGLDWKLGFEHGSGTEGSQKLSRKGTFNDTESSKFESSQTSKAPEGTTTSTTTSTGSSDGKGAFDAVSDWGRSDTWSRKWTGGANAKVEGVKATINLLKRNGAAKTLYATTLSTQSGIEAEFQNGGTIHRSTTAGVGSSGDIRSFEYGYIIKTTPFIIDANTINLDFSVDNKQLPANYSASSTADLNISRYQTKSKYLVRPGESIALSGYDYTSESETKKGTPWLSNIPWVGEYLFGNTHDTTDCTKILLVVTVDWAVENDSADVKRKAEEMRGRSVEVEMP